MKSQILIFCRHFRESPKNSVGVCFCAGPSPEKCFSMNFQLYWNGMKSGRSLIWNAFGWVERSACRPEKQTPSHYTITSQSLCFCEKLHVRVTVVLTSHRRIQSPSVPINPIPVILFFSEKLNYVFLSITAPLRFKIAPPIPQNRTIMRWVKRSRSEFTVSGSRNEREHIPLCDQKSEISMKSSILMWIFSGFHDKNRGVSGVFRVAKDDEISPNTCRNVVVRPISLSSSYQLSFQSPGIPIGSQEEVEKERNDDFSAHGTRRFLQNETWVGTNDFWEAFSSNFERKIWVDSLRKSTTYLILSCPQITQRSPEDLLLLFKRRLLLWSICPSSENSEPETPKTFESIRWE